MPQSQTRSWGNRSIGQHCSPPHFFLRSAAHLISTTRRSSSTAESLAPIIRFITTSTERRCRIEGKPGANRCLAQTVDSKRLTGKRISKGEKACAKGELKGRIKEKEKKMRLAGSVDVL